LLSFTEGASDTPSTFLVRVIEGWLNGHTYAEIAEECESDVEEVLTVMCEEIGFRLQDSVAKLSQIALTQHGTDNISETAQAWPSLLQYGLGTLQQLDLCEHGATDRLAVWGISRFLNGRENRLRGWSLVRYLRRNALVVRTALTEDQRVPRLCVERVLRELRIH
jgi:hypothetical protein